MSLILFWTLWYFFCLAQSKILSSFSNFLTSFLLPWSTDMNKLTVNFSLNIDSAAPINTMNFILFFQLSTRFEASMRFDPYCNRRWRAFLKWVQIRCVNFICQSGTVFHIKNSKTKREKSSISIWIRYGVFIVRF